MPSTFEIGKHTCDQHRGVAASVYFRDAQDSTRVLTATPEPREDLDTSAPIPSTHGPEGDPESAPGFWERFRRVITG